MIVLAVIFIPEVKGQAVTLFKNKSDSIEYAKLEAQLNPIFEKSVLESTRDSAMRVRQQFLEGKQYVIRWKFNQDRSYTPYQLLSKFKNKDSITKISVVGNGRSRLPDSLYRYKKLESLELIDFKLKKLPRRLHISRLTIYNNFPSKPLKLSRNSTIRLLTIRGDEEGMLPRRYNKLRNLEVLILARNNLKVMPNIEGCYKLKSLNFNNNSIASIDPAVSKLSQLESLSLYRNEVKEIPDFLYTMKELRVIDFYYNHIKLVSPKISNWKNLEILYLANNEMYSIPEEIGELKNLKELYVHHNKLSSLPASIGNLNSLYTLRINNNNLYEWPEGVSHLKGLMNFDCSFNQFTTLPMEELDFANMKILSIGGNPWDPNLKENIKVWVKALRENETVVHVDNNLVR